jgi:hypothetical protein
MIGRVKNISRFGIFISLSATDLALAGYPVSENDQEKATVTGLLRWPDVPKSEKFHRNETLAVAVKAVQADGKIDLVLLSEDFLEKYDTILARTWETLQTLQARNQEVRNL